MNQPIKLLMLNYEFPPIGGGGANANLQLLKHFAENPELEIDLLTSGPKPGVTTENFASNITITRVGLHKKHLHYWRKIEVIEWLIKSDRICRKMINRNNYHLAHAFFAFPTGWLCYRNRSRLPYIISLRGSDVPGRNLRLKYDYKVLAPIFRRIWKNARILVACSEGLKNRALKFLPDAPICVIPNGVDTTLFTPEATKPEHTFNLITVGRLSPTKRLDTLIRTVEILKNKNHNVKLHIAGSGRLLGHLQQTIREKNLGQNIELLGRVESEKIPPLYKKANLYISATMQEGMSNSMLEAMASGLPIITTPCEGLDELLDKNGIIVPKPEPDQLARTVESLIHDRETLAEMSRASRDKALKFSWQNTARQYLELYKKNPA